MSDETLATIVLALQQHRRLPDGTADPSPLAGVQSKMALTLLPDGRFAEPRRGPGAPTTHILKVPDVRHRGDALLEAAALGLSRTTGAPTAEAEVLTVAGVDVLLANRFDRALDDRGRVVRIHQEDSAQALGLPARLKYQRRGRPGRRFDVAAIASVLDRTADPALERRRFIDATLFDLLIGNVDGHAKNHAVLHLAPGRTIVAPRYDLLPTRLDPLLTDELSYTVGRAERLSEVDAAAFDVFLAQLGIARSAAQRRLRMERANVMAVVLAQFLAALDDGPTKRFADLIAASMRQLLPALGVDVPEAARHRDAFVERGGGRQLGS
jgi:serine/threonine-protein kinase HipA